MVWRRVVPLVAIFAIGALYPFFTFDKMVKPSVQDCTTVDCVTIVAANLRHNKNALIRLARTEAKDADILIITEFPYAATSEQLLSLFPMDGDAQIGLVTDVNLQLGSRIAVISRKPLDDIQLQIESFPTSGVRPRGILKFDYTTTKGNAVKFAAVHPPPPKGSEETTARDAYLKAAGQTFDTKENFVMIGDFNLTPWEPGFETLPGKRAGDPRWRRTWNARNFIERLSIDHALIGDEIGLVETGVLQDVGSDHFPIHLVIYAEADKGQTNSK
ncbi:endonuclease/exonuclease/phosphatase family protein [Hellea balneolensis]|uniref:endonuclease/exonuclease/phosphatase family protein n=1 Tax=Hellea balneolensis TaxID=287478 RepID=UPI00138ACDFD|nr:endonuclease/exonuclease/phosphatase family protein [Hellea balneolensis]